MPVPGYVIKHLEEFKQDNDINFNNRLFNYKNTTSTGSNLHREYIKLGFDISIHELRHTYATNFIANGIDFKTAAEYLGHSVKMAMLVYSHVNDDMRKRAVDIINNYI